MISLPAEITRQVLSLTCDVIYDTSKKNPLFLYFVYSIIHNNTNSFHNTFSIFSNLVLRNLKDLDVDSPEPPVLYTLFRYILVHLHFLNKESGYLESIFKNFISKVITECFRHIIIGKHWTYYLDMIFACLNSFSHSSNSNEVINEMNLIMKSLVTQLSHMLQIVYSPILRERIMDIVFRLPIHRQYQWNIVQMLIFYTKGLAGPESLQKTGKKLLQ